MTEVNLFQTHSSGQKYNFQALRQGDCKNRSEEIRACLSFLTLWQCIRVKIPTGGKPSEPIARMHKWIWY